MLDSVLNSDGMVSSLEDSILPLKIKTLTILGFLGSAGAGKNQDVNLVGLSASLIHRRKDAEVLALAFLRR